MALTIDQNNLKRVSEGNKVRILAKINLDNSYPTGGYLIDPARLGLAQLQSFNVNDQTAGYSYDFDSTTSKLKVLAVGGGGGAAIFTGDPMGAHTHGINTNSENIFQSLDLHIRMVGATGNFTIGEVITGSTSAATATLTFVNVNPAGELGYTLAAGVFTVNETITGGTSGVTATVISAPYRIYPPLGIPIMLESASSTAIDGLSYYGTVDEANPDCTVSINTIVGSFSNFEIITGGTSGATAIINFAGTGALRCTVYSYGPAGLGFSVGETITGGTSAATAIVSNALFAQSIVRRSAGLSDVNPSGDFIMFYPNSANAGTLRVTYLSVNANYAQSAGTPSGTIAGGGGGGPAVEVANATDLSTVVNVEIEATGL